MFAYVICVLLVGIFGAALFGTYVGLGLAVATAVFLGYKALTTDWFVARPVASTARWFALVAVVLVALALATVLLR